MKTLEKKLLRENGIVVGKHIGGGSSAKAYEIEPYKGHTNMCIKYIFDCTRDNVEKEYEYYKTLYHTQPDRFIKVVDLVYIDVPDEDYPENTHLAAAMVMEKLEKVDRQNRSLRTALKILYDVAVCIGFMHIRKTFHRDVKLDNILYSPRTNTYVLIDYNVSNFGDETFTEQCCIGTLNNIAPESLMGDCSPRSDFYSLGMSIREYFLGRELGKNLNTDMPRNEIIEKLYKEKAELRPLTENDTGSPQLANVVNKLTSFDRNNRYKDYKDLIINLNKLVEELAIDISTVDTPYSVYIIAVNRNSSKFNVEDVKKLTNRYIKHYRITNSILSIYSFAQDISVHNLKNGEAEIIAEDNQGDFITNLISRTKKIYSDHNLSDKSCVHICVAGAKPCIKDMLSVPAIRLRRRINGHTHPSAKAYSIAMDDISMDASQLGVDYISLAHDTTELENILATWFSNAKEDAS